MKGYLSLKAASSFKPLRQERSLTSQLQKTEEPLGSDWGVIGYRLIKKLLAVYEK